MEEKATQTKVKQFVYSIWFKRNNKEKWINIVSDSKENAEKEFWKGAIEGYKKDEGDKIKDKSEEELLIGLKRRYKLLSISINNSYKAEK